MDYDVWLQRSAGCFDDYYEASDDEIFDWYEDYYAEDINVDNILYSDIEDMPYIAYLVAEAIIDKITGDEEFIRIYDAGFVEDLPEFIKKYPERAQVLCKKYIPKDANDLWNLLGYKGWDSLTEKFYENYNNR